VPLLEEAMTITRARLAELRGLCAASTDEFVELLDACEALLDFVGDAERKSSAAYLRGLRRGFEACREKAAQVARTRRAWTDGETTAAAIRALTPEEPT
jgi:hypothetical protein